MNEISHTRASKFLSLLLRHRPETIGLTLDEHGWADTTELLEKMNAHDPGLELSLEQLRYIVANNDKKRFIFSGDRAKIRANQGHSLEVDLQLNVLTPPPLLYHGTATKNIDAIKEQGLIKGSRQHVHLSTDVETAQKVGMRYGRPVVFIVDAAAMHHAGYIFSRSENGVWLTDHVPPQYINFTTVKI